jgi:hypothetical protein
VTDSSDSEDVGASTPPPPQRRRLPTWWWLFGLIGLGVGVVLGRAIPPPYADGAWWATFATSAGFGGSLAVLGALVAASIAYLNSRNDRRQKKEADDLEQWWGRFSWACERAVSTTPGESELGLEVLNSLIDAPWTRDEDNEMVLEVANAIRRAGLKKERRWFG